VALVVAVVAVAVTALRRGREASLLTISVLGLAAALQLGPDLYNSEALVFFWLILGLAATRGAAPAEVRRSLPGAAGTNPAAAVLAATLVLAVAGHLLSLRSLSVESQWKRLRWRMTAGMHPAEDGGGRWSAPAATFSVDATSAGVIVRWHAGDPAAGAYRASVSFYVDGALVERTIALPGQVRDTWLPLPAVAGFKRISVLVSPPFVPAEASSGSDRRQLGVFIHSVKPADARPALEVPADAARPPG
jgi:hypothetical protein